MVGRGSRQKLKLIYSVKAWKFQDEMDLGSENLACVSPFSAGRHPPEHHLANFLTKVSRALSPSRIVVAFSQEQWGKNVPYD